MSKTIINNILIFVVLVIAQALIFNNLVLFNTAVALVFIYFIIELPITVSINTLLTFSFLMGLSVDVFQDTTGLNALCCTILAFIKRPIFQLFVPRDEDFSNKQLSINTLGHSTYSKYMFFMVLIYCVLYFVIEAINYTDVQRTFLRILSSTAYTYIVIYALDSLTLTTREKRL